MTPQELLNDEQYNPSGIAPQVDCSRTSSKIPQEWERGIAPQAGDMTPQYQRDKFWSHTAFPSSIIPQECGSGQDATIKISRHGSCNCLMMISIIFKDKSAWKPQLLNDEQ
jgi:hypothetical protein